MKLHYIVDDGNTICVSNGGEAQPLFTIVGSQNDELNAKFVAKVLNDSIASERTIFDDVLDAQIARISSLPLTALSAIELKMIEQVVRPFSTLLATHSEQKIGNPADFIEATVRANIGMVNAMIGTMIPEGQRKAAQQVAQEYLDGLGSAVSSAIDDLFPRQPKAPPKPTFIGISPKSKPH